VEINVFLENTYEEYNIDEAKLYNSCKKIADYIFAQQDIIEKSCLKDLGENNIFFDIVLMNNEEIHRVNRDYRQKDRPTDVITFALFADAPKEEQFVFDNEIHLGEMMISLDKIEEQSKENNVTFDDEMHYIVAHGILHLLGFDHLTESDYNYMVDIQNKAKAILYDKI
jgi:probable rRNA maturation factor